MGFPNNKMNSLTFTTWILNVGICNIFLVILPVGHWEWKLLSTPNVTICSRAICDFPFSAALSNTPFIISLVSFFIFLSLMQDFEISPLFEC